MKWLKARTTALGACLRTVSASPLCTTTTFASGGTARAGLWTTFTSSCAALSFFLRAFTHMRLEPMPASHATMMRSTCPAGMEAAMFRLLVPPDRTDRSGGEHCTVA